MLKAWVERFSCRCGTSLKDFLPCHLRTKAHHPKGWTLQACPKRTIILMDIALKSAFLWGRNPPQSCLSVLGMPATFDLLGGMLRNVRTALLPLCRARLYHYCVCVVVVHSCLELKLIRHGWGASLVDVGQVSKTSHVTWGQSHEDIAKACHPKGRTLQSMPKEDKHDWGWILPPHILCYIPCVLHVLLINLEYFSNYND